MKVSKGLSGKLNKAAKSGFTLTEMLATIIIVLLVSAGLVTTVGLALKQYDNSMRNSEASVLASTLKSIISNELEHTNVSTMEMDASGNVIAFESTDYALKNSLSSFYAVDEDKSATSGYGQLFCGKKGDTSQGSLVIASASYTRGLGMKLKSITYNSTSKYFTVRFEVGYDDTSLKTEEFSVRAMNAK